MCKGFKVGNNSENALFTVPKRISGKTVRAWVSKFPYLKKYVDKDKNKDIREKKNLGSRL